jgi:pimeloyl-ACP methyl ester carboxylesterase
MRLDPLQSAPNLEVLDLSGAPLASPIVMLHEGLGSVSAWRDFPTQIQKVTKRRTVVYSRCNYGRSDPCGAPYQPDYMHREAREVLPALLKRLAIERPILYGHSDGASIALIYAASGLPIQGLVVAAPHVFVEQASIAGIDEARRAYLKTDLPSKLARHHRDADAAFWGWNNIWLSPAFRQWDIRGLLASIACPVLAIQGENDQYGTMAQLDAIEKAVSGTVESAKLPDCGHSPHRDRPEATLVAIERFVARFD